MPITLLATLCLTSGSDKTHQNKLKGMNHRKHYSIIYSGQYKYEFNPG
jgi:hypothetical protein